MWADHAGRHDVTFVSRLSLVLCVAAFCSILGATPAHADLEVNRVIGMPGEIALVLPPHQGARRARLRLDMPPASRVSVLGMWEPVVAAVVFRLESQGNDGVARPFASTSGMSPVVLGSLADTTGRYWLIIEAAAGTDTIRLSLQVNWSGAAVLRAPAASATMPVASLPRDSPASAIRAAAEPTNSLCRVIAISWREGGDVSPATLARDGLRIRLSGPVNPEMLRGSITVEVSFPGSQEGLTRYEEADVVARTDGDWILISLPPKIALAKGTIVRVSLDGYRLLARDGTMLDGEGSGLALSSGDGRPGGVFRSRFIVR